MYIDLGQFIAILVGVAAVFILLGVGIGYYSGFKDEELHRQKTLDRVATTPHRGLMTDEQKKAFIIGATYGQLTNPPQH